MEQPQITPEQQEELRKKLEAMSPEELKEWQKKQCIFCHIVNGKVQARKIYEDNKVIGVLDINPANPGHILLMPKEHHMIMPQMPEDELKHIFIIAKQLSNTLLRTLEVRGTNIIVANGPAAGQRAQHFMIHIIPRKEGDGLKFEIAQNMHSEEELTQAADMVRAKMNELLGIKQKELTAQDVLKPVIDAEFTEKKEEPEHAKTEEEMDGTEDEEDQAKEDTETEEDDEKEEKPPKPVPPDEDDDVDLDSISRVLHGR